MLPEFSAPIQDYVTSPRRVSIDTVDDSLPWSSFVQTTKRCDPFFARLKNPMNVAWHDYVGIQIVAILGKMPHGIDDHGCKLALLKIAPPWAGIKPLLNLN